MHIKEPLFFGANFNFFSNNLFQSTRLRLEVWKETDIFNSHNEKKKKKKKGVTGKKGKNTMVAMEVAKKSERKKNGN